jgi:ATP-dependent DNA ligase
MALRTQIHGLSAPSATSSAVGIASSALISEALAVEGRGRELFELMRDHDLEGVVAKRLADPYRPHTRWFKIKNPEYSQSEGRGELFNRRQ